MKQKQVQKQKQKLSKKEVERRVQIRIKQFNQLHEAYIRKTHDILQDIIDLRKIHNPDYDKDDLVEEKGLEGYEEVIEQILEFDNLNKRTHELQRLGKLTAKQTFLIANMDKDVLRKYEDEIVNSVVSGELSDKELCSGTSYHLVKKLGGNPMEEYNKIMLICIYKIGQTADVLERHEEILTVKKHRELLKRNLNKLNLRVKRLLNKYDRRKK